MEIIQEKNLKKEKKVKKKLETKVNNFCQVVSCLLVTLITCLKGHKSLEVLYVFQQCVVVSE